MKFKMFSVVVGDSACIANCPFCVSGEKACSKNLNPPEIIKQAWKRFDKAIMIAENGGADTVMFTSRGETTLYPDEITLYMQKIEDKRFPFIELQTNGVVLAKQFNKYKHYLNDWFDLGMSTITISMVSNSRNINSTIYTNGDNEYIDMADLVKKLHDIGFSVRLTCVMCKDWMDTTDKVHEFLNWAQRMDAEQVTMRPLNDEYRRKSAHDWINEHKMTDEQKMDIWNYLNTVGTALLELPRVGTVFDVDGQNVMFSKPLTKYTRDTNPENGRNIIFFRDGHIRYEWEMEGGILL